MAVIVETLDRAIRDIERGIEDLCEIANNDPSYFYSEDIQRMMIAVTDLSALISEVRSS